MKPNRDRFRDLLHQLTRRLNQTNGRLKLIEAHSKLEACAREICPQSLYRFRSTRFIDKEIADIRRGVMYLPMMSGFNDIKDAVPFVNKEKMLQQARKQLTKENARRLLDRYSSLYYDTGNGLGFARVRRMTQTNFESLSTDFLEHLNNTLYEHCHIYKSIFRVACLSENVRSTNMWALYAASGEGYAVEYKIPRKDNLKCSCMDRSCVWNSFIPSIFPVIYDGQFDATNLSFVIFNNYSFLPIPTEFDYLVQVNTLVHKKQEWEHEREWRIVCPDCDQEDTRTDPDAMYVNIHAKSVYLGYNMSKECKIKFFDLARETGILLFQVEEDCSAADSTFRFVEQKV